VKVVLPFGGAFRRLFICLKPIHLNKGILFVSLQCFGLKKDDWGIEGGLAA
jgi:hypothetical protein